MERSLVIPAPLSETTSVYFPANYVGNDGLVLSFGAQTYIVPPFILSSKIAKGLRKLVGAATTFDLWPLLRDELSGSGDAVNEVISILFQCGDVHVKESDASDIRNLADLFEVRATLISELGRRAPSNLLRDARKYLQSQLPLSRHLLEILDSAFVSKVSDWTLIESVLREKGSEVIQLCLSPRREELRGLLSKKTLVHIFKLLTRNDATVAAFDLLLHYFDQRCEDDAEDLIMVLKEFLGLVRESFLTPEFFAQLLRVDIPTFCDTQLNLLWKCMSKEIGIHIEHRNAKDGDEEEREPPVEESLKCAVCAKEATTIKMACCGHAACESCWGEWLKQSLDCPKCSSSVDKRELITLF